MAASNKKRKKLARELQAKTGLRYTDALERVRLLTHKEDDVQIDVQSPLMKAISRERAKTESEEPEVRRLLPEVEDAVRILLGALATIPVRGGLRSIGHDPTEFFGGMAAVVEQNSQVQMALGKMSHVASEMELYVNGPFTPLDRRLPPSLPKTAHLRVGGRIEEPSSWVPIFDGLGLQTLRNLLQICEWLFRPDGSGAEVMATEEVDLDPPAFVKADRLKRLERRRQSLVEAISSEHAFDMVIVEAGGSAVLEVKIDQDETWDGLLHLSSDAPEALVVSVLRAGDEVIARDRTASSFLANNEPVLQFKERQLKAGSSVRVEVRNPTNKPHGVAGGFRTRPAPTRLGWSMGMDEMGAVIVED